MRARVLLLLGLLVAGAAAACTPNQDGCVTCSLDGESCSECDSDYSLSGGACVQCSGGASDSGVRCRLCDANDPEVCLRCEATLSDVGAYIDASGACRACPSGCTSCRDGDGSCDSEQAQPGSSKSDEEDQPNKSGDDGEDGENGSARSCPERCSVCNRRGKCGECEEGWLLDETRACVQCGSNCLRCKPSSSGGTKCTKCASGYAPVRGRCQGCSSPACTSCPDGPSQCAECRDGFVAFGGGCTKCSISSCVRCDSADPSRCLECGGAQGADASGKCIEGQVQNCKSTDPRNAYSCKRCSDGYDRVRDDAKGVFTCQQAPPPASQKLRLRFF